MISHFGSKQFCCYLTISLLGDSSPSQHHLPSPLPLHSPCISSRRSPASHPFDHACGQALRIHVKTLAWHATKRLWHNSFFPPWGRQWGASVSLSFSASRSLVGRDGVLQVSIGSKAWFEGRVGAPRYWAREHGPSQWGGGLLDEASGEWCGHAYIWFPFPIQAMVSPLMHS
jgi:hypothetical protein